MEETQCSRIFYCYYYYYYFFIICIFKSYMWSYSWFSKNVYIHVSKMFKMASLRKTILLPKIILLTYQNPNRLCPINRTDQHLTWHAKFDHILKEVLICNMETIMRYTNCGKSLADKQRSWNGNYYSADDLINKIYSVII